MADDKSNRGGRDRRTVASGERYEVDYFANKHNLSREDAQALIDRVGSSRAALEAAIADRPRSPAAGTSTGARQGSSSAKRKAAPKVARKSPRSRQSRSVLDTMVDAATPVTSALAAAAHAVSEPAVKAVGPVAERTTATGRKVGKAARRATSTVGKTAAVVPKAAAKRAGAVVDSARAGVTGRVATLAGAAAAGLVAGLAVNLGRKIVVQAPSALAGDWLEAIKVEHRLAFTLFDALLATTDAETGKRTTLLVQLKHALGKHAFTEENVIYPALRRWGDKADADKLNHDHGYVKQNLYDLEEMDNAAPEFLDKVRSFRAEIEEHVREEETSIFPPLHAALGEAGNAKVTAQANKEGFKLA